MNNRRKLAAGLLLLSLLGAACTNGDSKAGSAGDETGSTTTVAGTDAPEPRDDFNQPYFEGEPAQGGAITIGVEANVASLDPAGALAQVSDFDTALALYDPLVTYGNDDGGYVPGLATKWQGSDDLKTWTFTLRSGVDFNDGTPFDADAVVKQIERLKDPATKCVCASEVALIEEVTAPDPTTVVFRLAEPNAFFVESVTRTIGMIASPTATAKWGEDYGRHPVGTGPFKLTSYDPLVLERNDNYWRKDDSGRQLPYLDKITVKAIPESPIRLDTLASGGIDMMQVADTTTIIRSIEAGDYTVQKVTGAGSLTISFNNRRAPFDDVRMRQAVAHAVNRDEINRILYKGARQPGWSPFATTSPYYDPDAGWLQYDPAEAKKLVSEATADGAPAEFTLTCVSTEESRGLLNIVQRQLAAVGITANLEFLDQGAYVNKLLGATHDYVAGCSRNGEKATPDLYEGWFSTGSFNAEGYNSPAADAAMLAIRKTSDEAELVELSSDLQVELARDVPAFPLLYDLFANVASSKVSGMSRPQPNNLGVIWFGSLYLEK